MGRPVQMSAIRNKISILQTRNKEDKIYARPLVLFITEKISHSLNADENISVIL